MKELLKEVYGDLLLIVGWGWVLFHLLMIKFQGAVTIAEPHLWILWVEIPLVSIVIILGIERLVVDIRK